AVLPVSAAWALWRHEKRLRVAKIGHLRESRPCLRSWLPSVKCGWRLRRGNVVAPGSERYHHAAVAQDAERREIHYEARGNAAGGRGLPGLAAVSTHLQIARGRRDDWLRIAGLVVLVAGGLGQNGVEQWLLACSAAHGKDAVLVRRRQ